MSKFKDISGQKFGRLTALYRLHNYHKKGTYWLCICECGNFTEIWLPNLQRGASKSCGCLQREQATKANRTHKKSNTHLYYIWRSMRYRCYNKHTKAYKNYGGRGIAVCSEWKDNFMAFYNWSMANGYNDNLTIDRIDNDKNYSPNNCRWVDRKQQGRNRRSNILITINGETHCLIEWCEILGLKYNTVNTRIRRGWCIEKALEL